MPSLSIETPTGPVMVTERDGVIVHVEWSDDDGHDETPVLLEARRQLAAYFAGTLTEFDLPLAPRGSGFQRQVYDAMSAIPFGETRTYGDIAGDLECPAQPVGQACGSNPIPIIIPCHRVVGANGLTGFSGGDGVETKVQLLRHEGAYGLLI